MAAIPKREGTAAAIFAALAEHLAEDRRAHLGASVIGRECERALWYAFRWCDDQVTEGRILRLFRRGQLEEEQVAHDLRLAGMDVHTHDEAGLQFRFSDVGGHFGGSMDGAVLGIVEAPKTWHVLEIKTHNAKSFARLTRDGVESSKPEHHAQVQMYMHWSGMQRALYVAVCKDTDEIHVERIHYEKARALALLDKARRVIGSDAPLTGISDKPEYYVCKSCPARGPCHERRVPEPTCRTCLHAAPEMDGRGGWSCARHRHDLTTADQRCGCPDHVYLPSLVPAEQIDADADANYVLYRMPDGRMFRNGTRDEAASVFSSREVYAGQGGGFAMLLDPLVQRVRSEMGGEIDVSHDTAA